jgi:hypothetical protein
MVASGAVTGCCNARNFYNLGGAHGHYTAASQEAFDQEVMKRPREPVNIAITNPGQAKTREYLEKQGWKTEQVGPLWVSTVSGETLTFYFQKARAEIAAKKKLEEADKLKAYEARRLEMNAGKKNLFAPARQVYVGKVLRSDIEARCPLGKPRVQSSDQYKTDCMIRLENYYHIKLNDNYYFGNWDMIRRRVYDQVAASRRNI